MTNLKKVFLVLVVMVLLGATVVFATNDDVIVIDGSTDSSNTANTTNTAENTANEANVANTTINSVNTTNTNTSTYNNTTNLPKTGADDYATILIIAVFAVSALYAYKKVRDYKNI